MKKLIVFMAFVSLVSCQASSNLKDTFLFGLGSGVSLIAPVMGYCAGQSIGHYYSGFVSARDMEDKVFVNVAIGAAAFGGAYLLSKRIQDNKYKQYSDRVLAGVKIATVGLFVGKIIF